MAALQAYLSEALAPFRMMGWPSASLVLMTLLFTLLLITWTRRVSWRALAPANGSVVGIKRRPHSNGRMLGVPLETYFSHLGRPVPDVGILDDVVNRKDKNQYYVCWVTEVVGGRENVVLYEELRLWPKIGRHQLHGQIQLDPHTLTKLRMANESPDDDDEEDAVQGRYNLRIRKVRWYDIRHWLLHPNREIRIVIWVTLITTGVPMFKDVVFG